MKTKRTMHQTKCRAWRLHKLDQIEVDICDC